MRILLAIFVVAVIVLSGCSTTGVATQPTPKSTNIVPTPAWAMTWGMGKDTKAWQLKNKAGNSQGIIAEFLTKDETFDNWTEMVVHAIDFTSTDLKKAVETWKSGLLQNDSKIQIESLAEAQGAVLFYYYSDLGQRGGVRKFTQGTDGIYSLTFEFKREVYDKERLDWWTSVIAVSSLMRNPVLK